MVQEAKVRLAQVADWMLDAKVDTAIAILNQNLGIHSIKKNEGYVRDKVKKSIINVKFASRLMLPKIKD